MLSADERLALIDRYADGPRLLREALADLPSVMWQYRPAEGAWSVHEILIHLADSEANAFLRCRLLAAQPGEPVMAYDQDIWANTLNYHEEDPEEALAVLESVRRSSASLLRKLPDSAFAQTVTHAEFDRPYTFDDWLQVYSQHIPDHIEQMQANLTAWNER